MKDKLIELQRLRHRIYLCILGSPHFWVQDNTEEVADQLTAEEMGWGFNKEFLDNYEREATNGNN